MITNLPPALPTPPAPALARIDRRNRATVKLLFIALLVLLLQLPLQLVNVLQQDRRALRTSGDGGTAAALSAARTETAAAAPAGGGFEAYRMVERALKHSVLVLALVFTAFFLFEILAGLRLHAVHYGLVGAAMCLFYLALLALGEVIAPGAAYAGAATASSALVTLYSAAILKSRGRAAAIGALLAGVHGILYVVLRMEDFALLAGTAALFAALAAVMFFTRHTDWHAHDAAEAAR